MVRRRKAQGPSDVAWVLAGVRECGSEFGRWVDGKAPDPTHFQALEVLGPDPRMQLLRKGLGVILRIKFHGNRASWRRGCLWSPGNLKEPYSIYCSH